MNLDRAVMAFAGCVVLIGIALSLTVHPWWIALTAFAMLGDRERCLEAGMNEYVSKPFKLKELERMMERFLNFSD